MSKEDLFKLISDRFDAWELVELLDLSTEEICRNFEDEVLDNIDEIKDLLNIDSDDEEEETTNYDEYE